VGNAAHWGNGEESNMNTVNTFHWTQLTGALGVLYREGENLPWKEIIVELRRLAAAGSKSNFKVLELSRIYRDIAISKGLIGIGELFNERDAESLPVFAGAW
jgi:hypothetical protein